MGSIQATRLPLGAVNLFGMHTIPPLTVTAGPHFTYKQRDGGLIQPPSRLGQESADIGSGTSCIKVCFSTNWAIPAYELTDEEKVPLIKKWLGQEGLLLIKTFTHEKEKWRTARSLSSVLNNKLNHKTTESYYHCSTINYTGKAMSMPRNEWVDYGQRQQNVSIKNMTGC